MIPTVNTLSTNKHQHYLHTIYTFIMCILSTIIYLHSKIELGVNGIVHDSGEKLLIFEFRSQSNYTLNYTLIKIMFNNLRKMKHIVYFACTHIHKQHTKQDYFGLIWTIMGAG